MPKTKKINKKKTSNVIPIKNDVLDAENNDQLISIEDQERERTNKFARKICDEIITIPPWIICSSIMSFNREIPSLSKDDIGSSSNQIGFLEIINREIANLCF